MTTLTTEEAQALSQEVLSQDEIETLNEARRLLEILVKRCGNLSSDRRYTDEAVRFANAPRPYTLGRLAEAFDQAGSAIFNAMNTAHSMCHVPMDENDLIRAGRSDQ